VGVRRGREKKFFRLNDGCKNLKKGRRQHHRVILGFAIHHFGSIQNPLGLKLFASFLHLNAGMNPSAEFSLRASFSLHPACRMLLIASSAHFSFVPSPHDEIHVSYEMMRDFKQRVEIEN
jgi:hypothetical protein